MKKRVIVPPHPGHPPRWNSKDLCAGRKFAEYAKRLWAHYKAKWPVETAEVEREEAKCRRK